MIIYVKFYVFYVKKKTLAVTPTENGLGFSKSGVRGSALFPSQAKEKYEFSWFDDLFFRSFMIRSTDF